MASVERVILVCDSCGTDGIDGNGRVLTHDLAVDGNSWQVDACHACWTTTYRAALEPLTMHAGRVRIPTNRKRTRPRALKAV